MKARPRRSAIVILATLSAFLVSCLFALTWTGWKANRAYIAQRLRSA